MTTAPRRSKKIRLFESSLEKIGRIMSKKYKVRIVFRANACHTDGRTIYLPAIPDDADDEFLAVVQGHLDHEIGHVIDTDFEALRGVKRRDRKLHALVNALEDPRIEKRQVARWRGTAANLRRSLEWDLRRWAAVKAGETTRPWDQLSDFGKVTMAATLYAQVDFNRAFWFIHDVVEPEMLAKVMTCEDLIRSAANADDTQQVIEISRAMMQRLCEQEDPVTEMPTLAAPSGDGSAQAMEVAPPDDLHSDVLFKQPEGTQLVITNVSLAQLETDAQLKDRAQHIREEVARRPQSTGGYRVFTTEGDVVQVIEDGDRVAYAQFMAEANRTVAALRKKMARALLASKQDRWERGLTRGKIDPAALFRVPFGVSKRVFRQRVETQSFDTCVQIMVDHSASMRGQKLDLAAKTSIVLSEVLHQIGVPFSVLGFSTGESYTALARYRMASDADRAIYTRWGNHWIGVYKEFDELWVRHQHKLIQMVHNQRMNTYDGESLRFAAQRLLARPERRKILLWLNDGAPCPNECDDAEEHRSFAKACADEVARHVELVAVGICSEAVRTIYPRCVVVNDIVDLPAVCLTELDALLRARRAA